MNEASGSVPPVGVEVEALARMASAEALRQASLSAPGTLAGDREPYAFSNTQPGRIARYSMETTGLPRRIAGRRWVILNRSAKI